MYKKQQIRMSFFPLFKKVKERSKLKKKIFNQKYAFVSINYGFGNDYSKRTHARFYTFNPKKTTAEISVK